MLANTRRVLEGDTFTAVASIDGFEIETSMNIQALRARLTICEVASRELRRLNGASNLRTT